MKIYHVHREQLIPKPINEVFAFFDRPENLRRITPHGLGFSILSPTPIEMKKGAVIEYRIKVAGIPMRWQSLISEYEPSERFVDEQIKGPYAFWKHEHLFQSVDGKTLVIDRLSYALPFGILGQIAHALFVKKMLKRIFDFREEAIHTAFQRDT